ncbi:MAG: ABC transporter ATP-binding protein [Spartobacteria bacterium]|nr:ABC transporter ATP-binding protein [Spartobacteria bacterium]
MTTKRKKHKKHKKRKQRIQQQLAEQQAAAALEDTRPVPGRWIYRLNKVSKYFYNSAGDCVAHGCNRVSLELRRGDFVAITGESGSGKSTLLSLLGFLASPNPTPKAGQFLFRADTREHDLADSLRQGIGSSQMSRWRADHIGFVFQNYHLMNHLSARANVQLGLRFASPGRDVDQADAVLEALGMGPYIRKRTRDLSGGQKQRISVARALVKRPDVLLADEPTGNLDTANKCLVLASLLIAARRFGATVILVTHEIEHPPLVADRMLVMRDGAIAEDRSFRPLVPVVPEDTLKSLASKIALQGYPEVFNDLTFD